MALKVLITGAAGQIAYSLIGHIANGSVFGEKQPIILHLFDIPMVAPTLKAIIMELEDCAFPMLSGIMGTDNPQEAFKDIDYALMLGAMPRKEGMERRDLLKANVTIFKVQGEFLDKYAKKTVKIVVVANPANTNCYILSKFAPSIPKENFSALTRLDHNRAHSQLAIKAGVPYGDVRRVIIWGNHSGTQYVDPNNCIVKLNGADRNLKDTIKNDDWLKDEFLKTIQNRGGAVIALRKLSSAMSAAKAICDHCRDWFLGTEDWVSMGVYSDGSYNSPKDTIFSFPVTIKNGKWSIIKNLKLDEFSISKLAITSKELEEEKGEALESCK